MPLNCSRHKGCSGTWSEAFRRSRRGQGKYRMSCMYSPSPKFWAALTLSYQYIKQETQINGEHGLEARAVRVIAERASRRIGQMAFELARARPRKVHISRNVSGLRNSSSFSLSRSTSPSPSFISQVLSVTDGLFRETVRNVPKLSENEGKCDDVQIAEQLVVYRFVHFVWPH